MPDATVSLGKLIFSLVYVLIFPVLLLALSGDWRWTEGWLFAVWFVGLSYATTLYLYRFDPALLAERFSPPGKGNQQRWDVFVLYGMAVGFLTWIVIMPLDAKRFAWSGDVPLWVKTLGGAMLLGSAFFIFRAFTDNTFLSPLVRIQNERRQHVVTTGVYGFVRHPLYLGAVWMLMGTPLLLGSYWGLGIGLALIGLLMGRIIGEEKLLTAELDGYAAYKTHVRYRLIPYLW